MQGYTVKDVARMLDVNVERVRSFARTGLVEPQRGEHGEYRFSFQDLALLRKAKGLSDARVPARRLRSALRKLKQELPPGEPLSGVQIEARGASVLIRRGNTLWDAESGQGALDFDRERLPARPVRQCEKPAATTLDDLEGPLSAAEWHEMGLELEGVAPDESRRAYEQALHLEPSLVDARINLGRLMHIAGDHDGAARQFRAAAADAPRNATGLYNLGVALEDLGRTDEAIRYYGQAIDADPAYADAYFNLARLVEETGDRRSAIRYLKTYRQLTD
ncbi:MAG: tetratricopeptide repeat protein [bacterium]|nr:tetratricopeptide repeat protein [bacterium]